MADLSHLRRPGAAVLPTLRHNVGLNDAATRELAARAVHMYPIPSFRDLLSRYRLLNGNPVGAVSLVRMTARQRDGIDPLTPSQRAQIQEIVTQSANAYAAQYQVEIDALARATSQDAVLIRTATTGVPIILGAITLGASIGGPWGALIGAAVGICVVVGLALFPFERLSFIDKFTHYVNTLEPEDRWCLLPAFRTIMNGVRAREGAYGPTAPFHFWDDNRLVNNDLHGFLDQTVYTAWLNMVHLDCYPTPPIDHLPKGIGYQSETTTPLGQFNAYTGYCLLTLFATLGDDVNLSQSVFVHEFISNNPGHWLLPWIVQLTSGSYTARQLRQSATKLHDDDGHERAVIDFVDQYTPDWLLLRIRARASAVQAAYDHEQAQRQNQ